MNYWIVARRFAHLQEELTRILRPLSGVRVIIDRRVRRRLAQLRTFPEAPETWALPEKEMEEGEKSQGGLISRNGSEQETSGT